jgi:hypothetical protein
LVLRSAPVLDRDAAGDLARRPFPEHALDEDDDEDLQDVLSPDEGLACIGCYDGLAIACHAGRIPDRPSELPAQVLGARPCRSVYLIAMISFLDWAVVGAWHDGQLRRAVSVPFNGQLADPPVPGQIVEDTGPPLPFEEPLWARPRPPGGLQVPFHPLDLGYAALTEILGLPYDEPLPEETGYGTVPLAGFRLTSLPGSAAEARERAAQRAAQQFASRLRPAGRYRLEPGPDGTSNWRPVGD